MFYGSETLEFVSVLNRVCLGGIKLSGIRCPGTPSAE